MFLAREEVGNLWESIWEKNQEAAQELLSQFKAEGGADEIAAQDVWMFLRGLFEASEHVPLELPGDEKSMFQKTNSFKNTFNAMKKYFTEEEEKGEDFDVQSANLSQQ